MPTWLAAQQGPGQPLDLHDCEGSGSRLMLEEERDGEGERDGGDVGGEDAAGTWLAALARERSRRRAAGELWPVGAEGAVGVTAADVRSAAAVGGVSCVAGSVAEGAAAGVAAAVGVAAADWRAVGAMRPLRVEGAGMGAGGEIRSVVMLGVEEAAAAGPPTLRLPALVSMGGVPSRWALEKWVPTASAHFGRSSAPFVRRWWELAPV
eukprot:SAG11_NODE_485_length_9035_cov_16.221352_8_plen_208_part_00